MKRLFFAGLFCLPLLLLSNSSAKAQGCASGDCAGSYGGGIGQGFGFGRPYAGGTAYMGFPACFGLFSKLHFHGPLYNYGPYTGYYPFEPYGPWNAQLQYTGPRPQDAYTTGWARGGLFGHGLLNGASGSCGTCGTQVRGGRAESCDSCGWRNYSVKTFSNVFKRVTPKLGCKSGDCGGSTDCAGCGHANASAPTSPILEPNPIQPTGFPRTER